MSVRVLVSVSGDHPIAEVAARLEAAGVQVEKVLAAVGVIVATVQGDGVRALAGVEGVGSVEEDREVGLPPPDSDVQ